MNLKSFIAAAAFALALPVSAGPVKIELSAEGAVQTSNDTMRVTVFTEGTANTPAEIAKSNNEAILEAIKAIKAQSSIKIKSQSTHTTPVYNKGGKIEAWRMRSDISLESQDITTLSNLVGRLQGKMGVAGMQMRPSDEVRKKAENEAILIALAAFKERSRVIAADLGKPFKIGQLTINVNADNQPPMPRPMARMMAADAAPMPVEVGESRIMATISGHIEIAE